MADATVAPRGAHPYHMYDAILAQPDAFVASIQQNAESLDRAAERLAGSGRLFLVGIGTSYHAAQIGEYLLRAYAPGIDARAVHAFDFALYGPRLRPSDAVLVVSHRGNKRYSLASLALARSAGGFTALITGAGETAEVGEAALALRTTANERSSAHTVSYVSAIGLLAALAARLGASQPGGADALPPGYLTETLPALLRQVLSTEQQMQRLAQEFATRRHFWLVGSGPSGVTAHEIALKIKETSYLPAEGMSTETMLHGPFQATEAGDLFCLIAPAGPGQERTGTLLEMAAAIGAAALVVGDGTLAERAAAHATALYMAPQAPEPFAALTCLIPLQLFAYWLAIARGTNPDGFRLEDPRFARARQLVQL